MINKVSDCIWEIPKEKGMLVPGIVFASDSLFEAMRKDKTLEQVKNVAKLPGIIEKSIALMDAHQGYGFPIGGVAAFDLQKGVISPGGVGYDINCGVRLLLTNIPVADFMKKRKEVINEIYKKIPSGVGEGTKHKLDNKTMSNVLEKGVKWCLENGFALKDDLERIEDNGCLDADSSKVSQKAKTRGINQLGTLGAGNHFLEIQCVESVFDGKTAKALGIDSNNVLIMIHTGSRGLGHQTASDYIRAMEKEYGIDDLPDRELVNAPIDSKLGKDYRAAMNAAANFAFANRQMITFYIREVLKKYFGQCKVEILYDVAHNIAKFEEHEIDGKVKEVCVHRKGATRSFGPLRKELPLIYRKLGQPIILPGSMGTFSYVLLGTNEAEKISFASTAHGAGRILSRSYAIKNLSEKKIESELKERDIMIKAGSKRGILEEAPEAYKDIDEVAAVSDKLGIGKLVVKLKPLAVIKG